MSMFSSVNVSQSGSTIGCRSKELQRKNEKTWWTTIRFESHISEMKMSFSDLKKRCENELSLPSFKFCRNKAVTITIIYKLQLH